MLDNGKKCDTVITYNWRQDNVRHQPNYAQAWSDAEHYIVITWRRSSLTCLQIRLVQVCTFAVQNLSYDHYCYLVFLLIVVSC